MFADGRAGEGPVIGRDGIGFASGGAAESAAWAGVSRFAGGKAKGGGGVMTVGGARTGGCATTPSARLKSTTIRNGSYSVKTL